MEFSGFLGNADLKQRLSASFAAGKASHCYLLCGPEGSGKRTLSKLLAAALLCSSAAVPCGRCSHCRKVFSGIHPDAITIDEPDKKIVPVSLIRRLQADAIVLPNEAAKKVYLIPRAQDMNASAQNAILKLIEEPPAHAVFLLLTTNADQLLPTVRSRCVELRLEPVPKALALSWLRQQFPQQTPEALQAAWFRSGGYLGQAAALLQGDLYLPQTIAFSQAYSTGDWLAMTQLLCSMEKLPRDKLQPLFVQWKQLLSDALLVRAGLPGSAEAAAVAHSRTAPTIAAAAQTIQQAMDACSDNIGSGHICGWLAVALRPDAAL